MVICAQYNILLLARFGDSLFSVGLLAHKYIYVEGIHSITIYRKKEDELKKKTVQNSFGNSRHCAAGFSVAVVAATGRAWFCVVTTHGSFFQLFRSV
jgi:hypothetical protein